MKSYGISILFYYNRDRILSTSIFLKKESITPPQRAIITPGCGTASLTIPLAEKVFELTAEVTRRLRER